MCADCDRSDNFLVWCTKTFVRLLAFNGDKSGPVWWQKKAVSYFWAIISTMTTVLCAKLTFASLNFFPGKTPHQNHVLARCAALVL